MPLPATLPVPCVIETKDFDFGAPERIKYLQTVVLWIRPDQYPVSNYKIVVRALGRLSLNQPVQWTGTNATSRSIEIDSLQPIVKVNLPVAGRYIRLRIENDESADPACRWLLSGYELHARLGGST